MEVTIIRKVELSMDEQKKYEVIKSLADHPAPNKQRAALTLGCTVRHINRMLKGYKEHGKAYFIHGNRGRKPANTIPNETRNLVVDLYRNKYYDANFVHFTELLGKHEDIHISPSAVINCCYKCINGSTDNIRVYACSPRHSSVRFLDSNICYSLGTGAAL